MSTKSTTTKSIIDVTEVAARTKLCILRTGAWRTLRKHRAETAAENERHNTDAVRVAVRLTDHATLKELRNLHSAAYTAHTRLTLPSAHEGMRLLPAGREFEHAEAMRKFADKHAKLVDAFLADYEAEKATAPARLNGLYDESMWPSVTEIAGKFNFSTRYLATPTDGAWGEWLTESVRAAEDELRERLVEVLHRVKDRCKSDGALRASVFDAVRDLAALVPDLDFAGDFEPVVEAMKPLTRVHAEQLRDDDQARAETAKKAADILSVLGGIK